MYQLFLGNASSTLMLGVASMIVGRVLGPAGYGLYTIALIVPPFLFITVRLGLDAAGTRYAARLRSEGRGDVAVSFVYVMTIFGVLTAGVMAFVFVGLSGPIANSLLARPELGAFVLPLAMLSVVGQEAYTVSTLGLTGLHRFDRAGLAQALQGLTRLLVSPLLVLLGYGVAGAVGGYTASFAVSGVIGVFFVLRLSGLSIPKGFWADVRTALHYGFPVYISLLAAGIVAPAINVVLALTVSNSEIGGYTAAGAFNTLILLFTFPVTTALFPLFSRKVEDLGVLADSYGTSLRFTSLLVLPVAMFFVFFSRAMMVTFWGQAYAFGGEYLSLLAVVSLLVGVGSQAFGPLLNGIGRTRDTLVATGIGSAVAVGTAYLLIGQYGVLGAIAGQVAGAAVSVSIGTIYGMARLGTGLNVFGAWRIYVASALTAVLCFPLTFVIPISELAFIAGAALFVVLYIPILAFVGALGKEDLGLLRGYFGFSATLSKPLDLAIRYYEWAARVRQGRTGGADSGAISP